MSAENAAAETIRCRAKVSPHCYEGKPSARIYGEDEPGMAGDGTYDGETVVCDSCYLNLGGPTHEELRGMGL